MEKREKKSKSRDWGLSPHVKPMRERERKKVG